ncbi:MAG: UDP-glucose--hexose-1-phosphate uridylyltransferase [Clostridiales bacterium]|nr:UDP-glucose--hexose-1-phosphate uridylyltransferase [Clostridiales bacterium]
MRDAESRPAYLIEKLLAYGLDNEMITEHDVSYVRNQLLELLRIEEPYSQPVDLEAIEVPDTATPVLEELLDYAVRCGIIPEDTLTYRDLFDTKIMGLLMPRPSEIISRFETLKNEKGIKTATQYFYNLCRKSDYIRVDRIARNIIWQYESEFGQLEVTINLTKPEKDPREIAALKQAPQVGYPKCVLCPENVGYAGRVNHPARQTLRILPVKLQGEQWYFQYSPYVYYNEHCIVLKHEHVPMKITRKTFARLFDFLKIFPHYFIGSNADLPIVGGSILNHDHFQGGFHTFPMEKAPIEYNLKCEEYPDVKIGVVHWPMSAVRISHYKSEILVDLADKLLNLWKNYSDPEVDILAFSVNEKGERVPHNTVTPIARITDDGLCQLDLVFRNNRTNEEHPMGIFHPHQELHHIKKENIGLIEVMGLFILPGRLNVELDAIKDILTGRKEMNDDIYIESHPLNKHLDWIKDLIEKHGNNLDDETSEKIIKDSVGQKCLQVLHHAGVFKATEEGRRAFNRFLETAGIRLA